MAEPTGKGRFAHPTNPRFTGQYLGLDWVDGVSEPVHYGDSAVRQLREGKCYFKELSAKEIVAFSKAGVSDDVLLHTVAVLEAREHALAAELEETREVLKAERAKLPPDQAPEPKRRPGRPRKEA